MEFAPFFAALIVGGFVTYRSATAGRTARVWWMLPAVMGVVLVYDAIAIGGFHLDGVTSFPVFAGIATSLVWLPIWGITVLIGLWSKKSTER